MFKEIGQFASLMKNLPKMREQMEQFQSQLAQITAEGDAGGGMIKVKVNGKMELVRCTISDEAMKNGDRELLEDLIVAAANQALVKVKQSVAEQSSKMMSGLGMPPGTALPE